MNAECRMMNIEFIILHSALGRIANAIRYYLEVK